MSPKTKTITETRCTCNACGKVWHYGKQEQLESAGAAMQNLGKSMTCCSGCAPAVLRMKLLSRLAIKAVRGYQIFISPNLSSRCRFYPSCSQYAVLAIQKNGFLKGIKQTVHRLRRCNRYNLDSCIDYPE